MSHPWSTACLDWEDRLRQGLPLVPDFPMLRDPSTSFYAEGQRALKIFKRLHVPDIIGTPRLATACRPWFFAIVEAMLGSYDVETNRRMIPEGFFVIPKKNAKTSYGAAFMLTAALMNRRPQAEFQLIAPTKQIADYAFRQIKQTIDLDPGLKKLFHAQTHIRTLTFRHPETPCILYIKAADTDAVTGGKQVGTLIDETHEFAKKAGAADVFLEIKGALTARTEGFVIQITTQSKDQPTGIFKQELDIARAVRDGRLDLPLLAVIYEMPLELQKTQAWRDPIWWPRLNPNFGASVDNVFLTDFLAKAEFKGPDAVKLFASAHFNVEIGVGLLTDHWPGARHWEKNGDPTLTLAGILERSDIVMVGGDGGGLDDLLGIAVLGRDAEPVWRKDPKTGEPRRVYRWLLWCHAWAHRDVLEMRKEIAPKMLELSALGELGLVDAIGDAHLEFADIVEQVRDTGKLAGVGFDPYGVKLIVDELGRREIRQKDSEGGGPVEGVSQGFRLQGTIKSFEAQLGDGMLTHGAQALMAWCVGNARVKVTGNAIIVTKQASGTAKIDPLMAAYDAAALMLNSSPPDESGWDTDDLDGLMSKIEAATAAVAAAAAE